MTSADTVRAGRRTLGIHRGCIGRETNPKVRVPTHTARAMAFATSSPLPRHPSIPPFACRRTRAGAVGVRGGRRR